MILIALGANLSGKHGAPVDTLKAAIDYIHQHFDISVIRVSDIYVSAPVPVSDQPWYHNAVIAVDTGLSAHDLLVVLQEIELFFGRVRIAGERNAARVLDLDIISYHGDIFTEGGLSVPHPRMADRAFVLLPMRDVSPEWIHPITGRSIAEMIDALPDGQDIQKLEEGAHEWE